MSQLITWDDGTEEDIDIPSSLATVTWDDGTEEEIDTGATKATDTIDTTNMGMGETDEVGIYTPSVSEEGGGTASPQDLQFEADRTLKVDIASDVEEVTAGTTSMYDSLTGNTAEKDKETTRLIKEKYGLDVKTEEKSGKKYATIANEDGTTRSIEIPEDGNILKTFETMRAEMGGAVAGGIAGAQVGGFAGPVGATVGAAIGSGIGAYVGSGEDIKRNRESTGIEQDEESQERLQMHAGITDLAGSVVISGIGKLFGKEALKNFTSIADLPKKERKAVQHLQEQSGLSDTQMEEKIRSYAKTTKSGEVSNVKSVEAASKASEAEQVGYTIEAIRKDPIVKELAIKESTDRSNVVGDSLGRMSDETEDEVYRNVYNRRTLDDEGRRKATDWSGLKKDLDTIELSEDDAIYKTVAENAEALGKKETDIFQAVVKPVKPDDKAAKFVEPWTDTQRGSVQSQKTQGMIQAAASVVRHYLPSADNSTVKAIQKAIKSGSSIKEIEETLISKGIEREKASIVAKEMAKVIEQEDKILAKQAIVDEKEAVKHTKLDAIERKAINAGIVKDNKAREKSIAEKAKVEKAEQTAKAKAKVEREADYGKQADAEADRLAKVDKATKAKAKVDKEAKQKADRQQTIDDFDESEAVLAGGKAPEKLYSKKFKDATMKGDTAKAKEWKKKLDDHRAKIEADKVEADFMADVDRLAKADKEDVLTPKKVQEAKESESPAVIRSENSAKEVKIGEDPEALILERESRIKAQGRNKQTRDKYKADAKEETAMEETLKKKKKNPTRDELDLVVNHPNTTKLDRDLAQQKMDIIDKKNLKAFEAGDISGGSKEGRQAQTDIRTKGVKDTGNKALIAFDQDYKGGGWASKATNHGRKLAKDAENASSAAEREVMLNNKKHFDEGLSDYYDSKDSIPNSVSDYLAGKPAKAVTPKKPKKAVTRDDGVILSTRGRIDRVAMAKEVLKDKMTPEMESAFHKSKDKKKFLRARKDGWGLTDKQLNFLTQDI